MKHKALTISLIAIIAFGCNKKATEVAPLTKTEMLAGKTSKKWQVSKYQRAQSIGSENFIAANIEPNILKDIAAEYADNLLVFHNNGVQKINEGAKGVGAGKDYFSGFWNFEENETKIMCTMPFGVHGYVDTHFTLKIMEISNDKLVLAAQAPAYMSFYYIQWTLIPIK
jgi:hypothetical protein